MWVTNARAIFKAFLPRQVPHHDSLREITEPDFTLSDWGGIESKVLA
jgi:hypothetical protein